VKNLIVELTKVESHHNNSCTLAFSGIMESTICHLHFTSFYLLHNSEICPCTFDKNNTLILMNKDIMKITHHNLQSPITLFSLIEELNLNLF
jgi:hypothetical protein